MATLPVIVDFDNVEAPLRAAGPVTLARSILSLVPTAVLDKYDTANVRLYGGWRSGGNLTNGAQRLVPEIRARSPTVLSFANASERKNIRVTVELADRPLGQAVTLSETFVRNRTLRKFRSRPTPWGQCQEQLCGMSAFAGLSHDTACVTTNCPVRVGEILVRDEQKMVDTLIVADIARAVFVDKSPDIAIVSSDTDMWPGLLLALNAGCHVTHVHTRAGWRTQRHLLQTIQGSLARLYHHTSP